MIRDLAFLSVSRWLAPSLFVYVYNNRHMRSAVLTKLRQLLDGLRLSYRSGSDFRRGLRGGGLFDSAEDVLVTDWAMWDWDDEDLALEVSADREMIAARGLVADIGGLAQTLAPLVLLVPQSSKAARLLEQMPKRADVTLCLSAAGVLSQELPSLIDAISTAIDRPVSLPQRRRLVASLRLLMREPFTVEEICEEIETAVVVGTDEFVGVDRLHGNARKVLRPLRAVVRDLHFADRWTLVRELIASGRAGNDLVDELYAKTARLLLDLDQGKRSAIDPRWCDRLTVWIVLLLSFAGRLRGSSDDGLDLWTSPDLKIADLEELLTSFQLAVSAYDHAYAKVDWDEIARTVHSGASPHLRRLIDLASGLCTDDTIHAHRFKSGLLQAVAAVPKEMSAEAPPVAVAFSTIRQHRAALRVFYRGLGPRFLPRPLVFQGQARLVRTLAKTLATCFLCDRSTDQSPDPCGMCDGCRALDFSLLEVDLATANSIDEAVALVHHKIAHPESFSNSRTAVILGNIECLPPDAADSLLLSVEASASPGIMILTHDWRSDVRGALKSRCTVVPVWE